MDIDEMISMVSAAAAVISTGMIFAVMLIVMTALHIGIKLQVSCQQGFHRVIRVSGCTAVQLDARGC